MTKRIILHAAFWISYVLFKTYLNFESNTVKIDGKSGIEYFILILFGQFAFLIVKIPLVYSLFYIMDKYLSRSWPISKSLFLTCILFAVFSLLGLIINNQVVLGLIYKIHRNLNESFIIGSIIYSFFVLSFPCFIAITIKVIRLNIKQKEMQASSPERTRDSCQIASKQELRMYR